MNERIKQLMGQALDEKFAGTWSAMDLQDLAKFADRFSELIVKECAKKTIQGLMSDPAFVQAMDEHYENKWSYRFD